MTLRKILLAALMMAPLASSPAPVTAQERGLDRAADATAQAESVAGWKNSAPKEPKAMPPGMSQAFGGDGELQAASQHLPPGISRTRDMSSGGDETGGGDQGDEGDGGGDDCAWVPVMVDGVWMLVDCNGNMVPVG